MKPSTVTIEVVLDIRRAKTNGSFPLKLRITYQRIQRYYKLKLEANEQFWEEVQVGRRSKGHNTLRERVESVKSKAKSIIQTFETREQAFEFDLFERLFFGQELEPLQSRMEVQDVYASLSQYITQLENEERVSTAMSYNNALQSFKKHQPFLQFRDVTPAWLSKYERTMLEKGKSISSIGIYLRALRIVMNHALDKGIISASEYPFGKKRYQIPASKNVKKALQITDIRAIRNWPVEPGSNEERNRDLWVFSYLCNGMNPKDIFRLTWRNMDGDMIRFYRQKTQHTTRAQPRRIDVVISQPVQEIIDRWGNQDRGEDSLLFPLFEKNLTPKEWDARSRDLIKQINKYMKRIGIELKLSIPLTSYVARHSYATVMKRSGASTEFISETLGHSNLRTTETYFDSFDDNVKRDLVNALL
ncbi:phage integrase SAM-like domain-containing protein [Fibrella aquatica]|uniref:phage integrase SAM-like domain-containing protein n=1 Tax=Fibrella aquatica TaxID=3242487 RepID=UPI003522A783